MRTIKGIVRKLGHLGDYDHLKGFKFSVSRVRSNYLEASYIQRKALWKLWNSISCELDFKYWFNCDDLRLATSTAVQTKLTNSIPKTTICDTQSRKAALEPFHRRSDWMLELIIFNSLLWKSFRQNKFVLGRGRENAVGVEFSSRNLMLVTTSLVDDNSNLNCWRLFRLKSFNWIWVQIKKFYK